MFKILFYNSLKTRIEYEKNGKEGIFFYCIFLLVRCLDFRPIIVPHKYKLLINLTGNAA